MSDSCYYHITSAGKLSRVDSVAEAQRRAAEGGFVWLDYFQPSKDDLGALIVPFGLHPLSVEDCTDDNQVPKMEEFPQNTFIIFNAFTYANRQLTLEEFDIFIGANYLITVSGHSPEDHRILEGIERVVDTDIKNACRGPAFLMHVILDHVVDHKFLAIEALEDDLDAAEEAMLADLPRFEPSDLLGLRRDLLTLRKSLFHEREILVKICRKDCPYIPDEAILHYRDIYDHLAKFFELTETYRDIVTSLMEMYLSMLNNQMAKAANDTNATVRRLTFITTIFMPLTLLAGIGGMSEWSMMTGPENWRIAYPVFLVAMVAIGVVSYRLLKWLERRNENAALPNRKP